MGKKITGASITLPAPFNATSSDPVDSRFVVETKADLINKETFGYSGNYCYIYEGMPVYVSDEKATYTYMGPFDAGNGVPVEGGMNTLDNWVKTGDKNFNVVDIQNSITEEVNRAKAAEQKLTNDLATEVTNRTNADSTLTTNLNTEINRAKAAEDKIEASVGLNADGSHKSTTGNYTSTATTIAGEISALDTQVKANEDVIASLTGSGAGSVSDSIKNAINNLDAIATSTDGTNVQVKVTEIDGKITTVNITKDTTASAANLTAEKERAEKAESDLATAITEATKISDLENNILWLTESGFSANVGLKWNGTSLQLVDHNNKVISTVSGSDFIKDGMLNTVELIGTDLLFTFNTDSGKEAVRVNMSSFVDLYDGSNVLLTNFTVPNTYVEPKSGDSINNAIANLIRAYRNNSDAINNINTNYDILQSSLTQKFDDINLVIGELENEVNKNTTDIDALQSAITLKFENLELTDSELEDRTSVLEGKLLILETGAKVNISISPGTIYKGVNSNITIRGTFTASDASLTPTKMEIVQEGTILATADNNKTVQVNQINNLTANTKTFTINAYVDPNNTDNPTKLTVNGNLNARYPIYKGFGIEPEDIMTDANKLSARTSANGTYINTAAADGVYYFILVPSDISAPNNFTMGGAPYVMNKSTKVINEITYTICKSGATYNTGATVNISAS